MEAMDSAGIDGVTKELVLVDNASTDDTFERFTAWAARNPGIKVVQEPKPGLGRARNTGWKAASGKIIVMTDDDCYVQPGFLDLWLSVFRENPEIGWSGGKILLHDPLDEPVGIDEWPDIRRYPLGTYLYCGAIQGANFAFRREVLEKIGGFDERMGAGTPYACEDIDAVSRASHCGYPGMYDPRPTVRHHHGRRNGTGTQYAGNIYASGTGAYHAKCILTPGMRWLYLRPFLARIKHYPISQSKMEIAGAWSWWRRAHGRAST